MKACEDEIAMLRLENRQLKEEVEILREEVIAAASELETEREDSVNDYGILLESEAFARKEIVKLRAALKGIYDLYPYINCSCGRAYPRMGEERREKVKQLVTEGGEE